MPGCAYKRYMFRSSKLCIFSIMYFDENPFTCQCENRKQKSLRVSNFTLLLVVLKWHGSEGVNVALVILLVWTCCGTAMAKVKKGSKLEYLDTKPNSHLENYGIFWIVPCSSNLIFSCLQREHSDERHERRAISWRPSSASRVRDTKIMPKRELFVDMKGWAM